MEKDAPRCLVTGNPCGTDTRPYNDPCRCKVCVAWAGASFIEEIARYAKYPDLSYAIMKGF